MRWLLQAQWKCEQLEVQTTGNDKQTHTNTQTQTQTHKHTHTQNKQNKQTNMHACMVITVTPFRGTENERVMVAQARDAKRLRPLLEQTSAVEY